MITFSSKLIEGTFIKKANSFVCEVQLKSGEIVRAHVAHTSPLRDIYHSGSEVLLSKHDTSATRKLQYTWEMVKSDGVWVGVNSKNANAIVQDMFLNLSKYSKYLPELSKYTKVTPEVKYGTSSRCDFLLQGNGLKDCIVEVKSVHWKRNSTLFFPDAVTARGLKQMEEMKNELSSGKKVALLYVAQRHDCKDFAIAGDVDPKYLAAVTNNMKMGAFHIAISCKLSPSSISFDHRLNFKT